MRQTAHIPAKIHTLESIKPLLNVWKLRGYKVAFTNGVFDLLHEGHIFSLSEAAKEADILVVAVNSDDSVKRLKGPERPLNHQDARALVLAALTMVDAVIIFEEDTPINVITTVMPDILVKGGDYTVEQIAGSKEVIENGGKVVINKIIEGISTTGLIAKMKA